MVNGWSNAPVNADSLATTRRARLRDLIEQRFDGNTSAFARAVKRQPQQVNDMLAGRKAFGEKVARAMEAALAETDNRVPDLWFDQVTPAGKLTISVEAKTSHNPSLSQRALTHDNVTLGPDVRPGGIPLISWVQAGAFCEAVDNLYPGDAEEWIPSVQGHGPRAFALRVRGDSMLGPAGELSFAEGDIILVDPDREALHRSLVIARLPDENEVTFKRLLIDGGRRYLQALNPSWPNRVIEIPASTLICGVVFGRWTPL